MDHAAVFTEHRPRMLAAAFHITGSREDAEDVVQNAWEAWSRVDLTAVHTPPAFLSVLASRLALNTVRAQRRRRETYVGEWLPDPMVDDGTPEWAVLQQEGLGQALDFVLSTLTPEQATAYVLRKVLDVDYASIADVLDTTDAAARQLVSRAQRAVTAAIGEVEPHQPERDAHALALLSDAVATGDVARVAALLAPDAVVHSDGGGKRSAALRPVVGADKVARLLIGLAASGSLQLEPATINGSAGLLAFEDGLVTTAITLHAGRSGIASVYFVRNPDKLTHLHR